MIFATADEGDVSEEKISTYAFMYVSPLNLSLYRSKAMAHMTW